MSGSSQRSRSDRGGASVVGVVVMGLSMLILLALARLGGAVVLQARADAAADAAALAAADALALGGSPGDALQAAQATAEANDAHVNECRCAGSVAEVRVTVKAFVPGGGFVVSGRARAEVEIDALFVSGSE